MTHPRGVLQLLGLNSAPLFLLLDPNPGQDASGLPVTIFERVLDAGAGASPQNTKFVAVPYSLATEEAERIGVDHMANVAGSAATAAHSEGSGRW